MPMAYVLINTEIGAESRVLEALKMVEGVVEAHHLWGVYDIIASIKAETMDKLKYIITKRIGTIGKVNAKLMMIATEKQTPPAVSNAVVIEAATVQNG